MQEMSGQPTTSLPPSASRASDDSSALATKSNASSEAAKLDAAVEQQFAAALAKIGLAFELCDVSDWIAGD
jgi:hypothetical protein